MIREGEVQSSDDESELNEQYFSHLTYLYLIDDQSFVVSYACYISLKYSQTVEMIKLPSKEMMQYVFKYW